jgi:hopanoid-associated phosphorylase
MQAAQQRQFSGTVVNAAPSASVGIIAALAVEARHLGRPLRRAGTYTVLTDGTLLAVSGIGCAAAAHSAQALVQAGAGALASFGLAGGLDPTLIPGAVFIPTHIVLRDSQTLATTLAWRERMTGALATLRPVGSGALLTSARPLLSIADKLAARRETGAAAVDMESFAIAEVAQAHGLPFVCARVIVDTAGDALPDILVHAADHGGRVRVMRLLAQLVRAPGDLGALLHLARCYRIAHRSLRAVARGGAWSCGSA